jgi:hypothetical protein
VKPAVSVAVGSGRSGRVGLEVLAGAAGQAEGEDAVVVPGHECIAGSEQVRAAVK